MTNNNCTTHLKIDLRNDEPYIKFQLNVTDQFANITVLFLFLTHTAEAQFLNSKVQMLCFSILFAEGLNSIPTHSGEPLRHSCMEDQYKTTSIVIILEIYMHMK